MQYLIDLIQNPLFMSAGAAWFTAQFSKFIYEGIRFGFRNARFSGGGGMPSAHSATTIGLVTSAVITYGTGSAAFAISLFLASVVILDATGVRLTTGKQSAALNKMNERLIEEGREPLYEKPLDERMGHTLPEVIAGIGVGIAVAILMCTLVVPAIRSQF